MVFYKFITVKKCTENEEKLNTSDCNIIVSSSRRIEHIENSSIQNPEVCHSDIEFEDNNVLLLDTDIVIENDECDTTSSCSSEESAVFIEDESKRNEIYSSSDSGSDEESDEDDESRSEFDSKNLYNLKKDKRIMFPASNLTVSEVLLMLKGIIIKSNMTRDIQIALLQLIQTLAGPKFDNWNYTPYLISKMFKSPSDKIKKHYYCSQCNVKLLLPIKGVENISKSVQCEMCEKMITISSKSLNYFITVDIKYQLQLLLNRPDIQENMDLFKKLPHNNDTIDDVTNCELYKNIQKEFPNALTFNFNGDGAQFFNSAKKSLWPLQLHINELTPNVRFKHIILAALLQTEKEPTADFMNLFMITFVEEYESLRSEGIDITDHRTGITINKKILPLFGCTDSVARALFQNRIKFNGRCGCSYCYHPGKYDSVSMRYPLLANDPEIRSHNDHLIDLEKTLKFEKWINGVKGDSILLQLPIFDIIWSFPPDYTHGTLLGVVRQLFRYWNTFYFNQSDREEINKRMGNIKLCRDIRRNIRSIDLFDKYKATELKTWLLFVSLPCLYGILPKELFDSYALFVSSIYKLVQKSITNADIAKCEFNLMKFVGETQIFYGVSFITFNVHCIIHYCLAVRKIGPLWGTSAFPFENGIYKFLREMNAPNGCVKQIADKWLKSAEFQNYLKNENTRSPAIEFCQSIFFDTQQLQNVTIIGKATLIESGVNNIGVQNYFRNFTKDKTIVIKVYDHCIYESKFIHTVKYNRVKKTDDSVI